MRNFSKLYLNENINQNDKIYVNYFSQYPVEYYKETSMLNLSKLNLITGDDFQQNPFEYLDEIKQLNGHVWFLFTEYIGDEQIDKNMLESYLNEKHIIKIKNHQEIGASIFLVDFK